MADARCFMHKQQQLVVTAVYASAPSCNCQGFMHVYAGIACYTIYYIPMYIAPEGYGYTWYRIQYMVTTYYGQTHQHEALLHAVLMLWAFHEGSYVSSLDGFSPYFQAGSSKSLYKFTDIHHACTC